MSFAFIFIFWDHCWFLIRKWCIPAMYLYLFFIFMIKVVFIWRFRVIGRKETDQLFLESCFQTVIYRTRGLFRQNWGCRYYRYRHDPDVFLGKLHASLECHHIEYFTLHVTQCFYPFGFTNIVSKILLEICSIYIVPLISLLLKNEINSTK